MLLKDNSCKTPQNDTLDPSMFQDLIKNDLENGVKGKHFQEMIISRVMWAQIEVFLLIQHYVLR